MYGHEVDIWSFECILSEMYWSHVLFGGENTKHQMTEIMYVLGVSEEEELEAMNASIGYAAMKEKYADSIEAAVDAEESRNWGYALMPCEAEHDVVDLFDSKCTMTRWLERSR